MNETIYPVGYRPNKRKVMVLSSRQAMLALIDQDLDLTVENFIKAIPGKDGKKALAEFQRAQEWRRDWPLLNQIAQGLGWSSDFVDNLFAIGAKL